MAENMIGMIPNYYCALWGGGNVNFGLGPEKGVDTRKVNLAYRCSEKVGSDLSHQPNNILRQHSISGVIFRGVFEE